MSQTTITLKHGLKLGEVPQLEAVVREMTVGVIVEACADAEKLVLTADGWQFVQSPTLVGIHALRRQVVRIGDIPGPIDLVLMKKLHPEDLALLQATASALDAAGFAALQGVGQGGRVDGTTPDH